VLQQGLDGMRSANADHTHDKLDVVINVILVHEKPEAILNVSGMCP
jgi:hypothetical protein